jgi:hypothetical protein
MNLLALGVLALMAGATPQPTHSRSTLTCPPDDEGLRSAVLTRISNPRMRTIAGLTAVDPAHLRALADPSDASACQTLRGLTNLSPAEVPATMTWAYSTAAGYYFAAGIPNTSGTRPGILLVFDSSFNRISALTL